MRGSQSGRFIQAPRGIQQQLREAKSALEEQRYSDAVVRLGDLLSLENENIDDLDLAGQDFFVDIEDSRTSGVPVSNSLLRTARRMIGQLPTAALETYELRYGPLARKLLSEAAKSRDWDQVREVRRKYLHTEAGFEASVLLAQHEMFGGHPLAASILLDDIVRLPRAVNYLGNEVLVLHASALRLAGRDLSSLQTLQGAEVNVGGKSQSMPTVTELLPWLDERVGKLDDFAAADLMDYPMFGARPDRNGASSGQMPLTNLRWMLDTTASPRQEQEVRKVAEELTTSGKLPPPSWIPLRVGDQLLMRTTERLVGIDYRTGKRVWTYPWQSAYEFFDEEDSSLDGLSGEEGPDDLLSQRVWNDVPYGRITSDGERVFILDDLREVEMASFSALINMRGTRPADTGTNTLVALDLASEGKLLWRLGAGADAASSLSDAFFLGPPLPVDGQLYVMVEIAGDINLCCLDPATGDERWRQQLVAVESGGIDADPIRRVAGATPTYHEGLMICPTGAGAIVAIDLGDRMLRWGVNYDRNTEMIRSVSGRGRGFDPSQLMQRWYSGAAVASENALLVTPIESDRLFGFNLLTGESLFAQKNRVHLRYLAGIRDGRFFVVGATQVRAFDLRSGSTIWTTPRDLLAAGQQISGYGVFGKHEYLIPTTSNQIVRISLADGTVIDRRSTRYPLGNLVSVGGEIIAQGPTTLAVAFGEATLEPLVNRMLEKDPNDFDAMVRKSELLIQHGQRDEALEMLTRAREMQPENDEVRMLSVSAMLGTLRENLNADNDLVATLNQLIDRPSQRVELLSLRIRAALEDKEYEDAVQRMIDLSSLIVAEPLLESSADQVVNDTSRQCSLDGWLTARTHEMATAATDSELNVINQLIRRSNESKRHGSKNLLKRVVRHFGSLDGIEPMRTELAERFQADDANLELERLALSTQIPSNQGLRTLTSDRLMMLSEAYATGEMPKDAIFVLDQLAARGDTPQSDRGRELRQLANSQIAVVEWAEKVSLNWVSRATRIRTMSVTQRVAETNILAGKEFEGWRLVSEGTSPLAFRDPTGLLRRIQVEGLGRRDQMDKEAQICGGVMVVVMPNGLIGIDLYNLLSNDSDPILWRRGLSGDGGPVANRKSHTTPFDDQVVRYVIASRTASNEIPEFKVGPIMGDRVLLLQGGDLLAIDLFTAETLWRNSTAPKSGAVLSDGERVAVVRTLPRISAGVPSVTGEVAFFDIRDGRKLETTSWEHGEIWESIGTNVLTYRATEKDNRKEVRLVNPFTGEVILRHESFAANRSNSDVACAYGRIVGGRYLALLDSDGQAIIWDLMEGREVARPKLPAIPDLQGLRAMLLEGQLILLPKRRMEPTPQLHTTDGSFHRTVHGVHAVSLQDGSLRWSEQFDEPWGCTLTQPAETPVLVLTRSHSSYSNSTTSRRKTLDALALDVRDGSTLNKSEGKQIMSTNNELETRLTVQPTQSRVVAQIGSELLTYNFGATKVEQKDDEQP